jgi:hypothetical protein
MDLPDSMFKAGLNEDWNIDRADQLRNLPIMWLRGGAGAGKSAVAQTFAERCEDLGHIVASFFFFSTDPARNSANSLVATLAYQIAQADPGARAHIEAVVHQDPRIFDKDFKRQITSLIISPLQKSMQTLSSETPHRPCIVIIDGLDECTGGQVQAGIVRDVCDALRAGGPDLHQTLPRFLICSRPEEPIMRIFRSSNLQGRYTSINLSRDGNADSDIRTFLEGKLTEIKQTHERADLIPALWPSEYDLSTLVWNSSGHFIYAQTVIRLVSSDTRPVAALEGVLGLRALPQRVREPWAELDQLYRHILLRAQEKSSMDTIRHVLGCVRKYTESLNLELDSIALFLGLEDGDLDTFLSTVSSLVQVTDYQPIRFYHKSFGDFLEDEFRAAEYYIEEDVLRGYVWDRCLDIVSGKTIIKEGK